MGNENVQAQVTMLNSTQFMHNQINSEALIALSSINEERALDIIKELQKKQNLKSPSNYLMAAASREPKINNLRIQKRVMQMNGSAFAQNPIDAESVEALSSIDEARAMDILRELEKKGSSVNSPGNYIKASVSREPPAGKGKGKGKGKNCKGEAAAGDWMSMMGMMMGMLMGKGKGAKGGWMSQSASGGWMGQDASGGWMSQDASGGWMSQDASGGCMGMDSSGDWMSQAASGDWMSQGDSGDWTSQGASGDWMNQGLSGGTSGDVSEGVKPRVQQRVMWNNANAFAQNPIDQEAIQALSSLQDHQAMAILKQLEENGASISNPSSYLKAAVCRELSGGGGLGGGGGGGVGGWMGEPFAKRQKMLQ